MKKSYYIIIRGPLGCGKSTIAKLLTKTLKAKYIAIDRIVDNPKLIKREIEKGYISQKNFFRANKIAVKRIKELIKEKIIVFDGNFYWKSTIQDLKKKLKKYKGYIFTLKAPLKICTKRDSKRKKTHGKDAAKAVYKKSTSFK